MGLIRFLPLTLVSLGAVAGMALGLNAQPDTYAARVISAPGSADFSPAPNLSPGGASDQSAQVVNCRALVRQPVELVAVCSDGSVKLTKTTWNLWQSASASGNSVVVRTTGAHKGAHSAIVSLEGAANYAGMLIFTTLSVNYNDGSPRERFDLAQAPIS